MVGREKTPAEQAAWNQAHLATRVHQAGVGIDSARRAVGRARAAREAGNLPEAARNLRYAAGERSIAFRFGADTKEIAGRYGMPVPTRGAPSAPTMPVGVTPENKSRGRRSWMPGKGLG